MTQPAAWRCSAGLEMFCGFLRLLFDVLWAAGPWPDQTPSYQ